VIAIDGDALEWLKAAFDADSAHTVHVATLTPNRPNRFECACPELAKGLDPTGLWPL